MQFSKILRSVSALAVIAAAVYFFFLQFKDNADAIGAYDFSINPGFIFLSIIFGGCALLIGPLVWRIFVNACLEKKLNYSESFALYCTSAMFKYIPGKIWTYAAQIALMSSKEISKVVLLYINMVSFICLFFVAAVFSLYYYLFYIKEFPLVISLLIFILFIIADIIFIIGNNTIMNYLISPMNRLFKVDVKPIKIKNILFVYTQLLYGAALIFLGMAMYFLARGININLPFTHIIAVMATIATSLILGLMAFFSMGGLGVREGVMFVMLQQFSNVQAALILPVVARALNIVVELLMGLLGILIGMKYHYFPQWEKHRQNDILEKETQTETL